MDAEQTVMIATIDPFIEDAIKVCKLNFTSEIIKVALIGSAYVEELK